MDNHLDALLVYGNVPPDHPYLPNVELPVYIMGDRYSSIESRDAIAARLCSLFWMTYRRGFYPSVVSTGPTSDAGWGCMHRCGQMMLAEAIIRIRLGEAWRWTPGCQAEAYCQLRRMFQDTKSALYSIQNIAMIGMVLDKPVGSWFGPNTTAQVIKKLCAYDPHINWYVHISVEDGLIVDEIKTGCHKNVGLCRPLHDLPNPLAVSPVSDGMDEEWDLEAIKARFADDPEMITPLTHVTDPITCELDEDFLEVVLPPTFELDSGEDDPSPALVPSSADHNAYPIVEPVPAVEVPPSTVAVDTASNDSSPTNDWRPLLLFISLRLGVQHSNPCYFPAIKAVLKIPQCIGIMGGRPSHAVWIVGVVGEDSVLCLDPHYTQSASLDDPLTDEDDRTHHCDSPVRMPIGRLDPSMVLGFLCSTEESFDELCTRLQRDVLGPQISCGFPLFEMHQRRPFNLPPTPVARVSRSRKWSCDAANAKHQSVDANDCAEEVDATRSESDGRLGEAVSVVRELWSKCNRVAGDTMRSLVNLGNETSRSGAEFELL